QTQQEKQVKKEVQLEDENGVKTLTIKTTSDGNVTTEVYTGAEADAKIAEFEQVKSGTTKTMFIGDDGKQHLKVETKIVTREEIDNEADDK
ncbi:MAG: hypothetical protein KDD41_06895, partial [Flavobacteriales bacterium]|nr:hypothetical protein [Flavobacteriales bacterium]